MADPVVPPERAPRTPVPTRNAGSVRGRIDVDPGSRRRPSTIPCMALPVPDRLGRSMRDLRISVTDRCNFRCTYCMPREIYGRDFAFLPRSEVLTFEEIRRLAGVFVGEGVEKLRITGGEPLVRHDLPELVRQLADLRLPDGGRPDLTLTTNGSALRALAGELRDAGLARLTVSLDSLDDATFRVMNGVDFPVARVLDGIAAAREAGFGPLKVNMVVRRGLNESSVLPMARWARTEGHILRLIEFMDVGHSNGWRLDEVVPAAELVAAIDAELGLEVLPPNYPGEVADRWRYRDGSGEVGLIASVTRPFCGSCTRARLSAEGRLYTCLFAGEGTDLRAALRSEASDDDLREVVRSTWRIRADRYSELRSEATAGLPRVEMFAMGG
jgi:GTP 3',8-cyclase